MTFLLFLKNNLGTIVIILLVGAIVGYIVSQNAQINNLTESNVALVEEKTRLSEELTKSRENYAIVITRLDEFRDRMIVINDDMRQGFEDIMSSDNYAGSRDIVEQPAPVGCGDIVDYLNRNLETVRW